MLRSCRRRSRGASISKEERRDKISDKISYLISSYLIERREEEEVVGILVVVFTKFLTRNISTYIWPTGYGTVLTVPARGGWNQSRRDAIGWRRCQIKLMIRKLACPLQKLIVQQ